MMVICCFVAWIAAYAQTGNTPNIYALVVGISNYTDENIPNLKYAKKDAEAFSAYLKTGPAGAISADNMVVLTNENATRANIMKALTQLVLRTRADDMLIFYFSGHGTNGIFDNEGYFLTYDTEFENESGTAVSMNEIITKISRSTAKLKISYVDACHAGLFKSKNTKGNAIDNNLIQESIKTAIQNAHEGEVVLLSSSARQQSIESETLQHGIFTYYLLKGLKGEADKGQKNTSGYNDGIVTIGELNTYLTNAIEKETNFKQRPSVEGNFDDQFPLSVLKPGKLLTKEIEGKKKSESREKPETAKKAGSAPPDEKLPNNITFDGKRCYGQYVFINNTDIPLTLYAANSRNSTTHTKVGVLNVTLKISPGESATTPRIGVYSNPPPHSAEACNDYYEDHKFYFKGEKNGKLVYVVVDAPLETRKKKYYVLSNDKITYQDREPRIGRY